MCGTDKQSSGLKPVFSSIGIWAFSIGTSIGWGSVIVTCNTYLLKSGVLGTVLMVCFLLLLLVPGLLP